MPRALLLLALLGLACAQKPAARSPAPPAQTPVDPCAGCAEKGGTCVDGTCTGYCTAEETSCPTGTGKQCCRQGQKCCSGVGADGCFAAGDPCPVPCAGGGTCPLGSFCQGGSCVADCAPRDRCGTNGCCAPGWACSGETCSLTNLTLDPGATSRLDVVTLAPDACEVQQGCVKGPGVRNLFHLAASLRNAGTTDLVLGDPASSPFFAPATCGGGPALKGFLQYRILDAGGAELAQGRLDVDCVADGAPPDGTSAGPRFACGAQGLQPGWSGNIPGAGACTGVDVTDLPAGQLHALGLGTARQLPGRRGLRGELDRRQRLERSGLRIAAGVRLRKMTAHRAR